MQRFQRLYKIIEVDEYRTYIEIFDDKLRIKLLTIERNMDLSFNVENS